ncbi:glutarate dioxygenase GlaH [Agarilytica rhodophyticola]|uniref:glutarate dioxygenase GlaH n=1 Tax=Agarilytica rhodophyticola TaxID=1737490 RepID=UPI000B3485B3|nr:glutarate dioxygenase GlaH [Agarilytica rhodophyticola]
MMKKTPPQNNYYSNRKFNVAKHKHHTRLKSIELTTDVIEDFLDQVKTIDIQSLEYVPFLRFCLADKLLKSLGEEFFHIITQTIYDRASGGFTINFNSACTDHDGFIKLGTAVAHLLGAANHDAMSGTFFAKFSVKHSDNSDSYLRQAYRLFTLHTDGTFVDEQTDWLLMMKFSQQHAVGGESRVLHLDDWLEIDTYADNPIGRLPFEYKAPSSKNANDKVYRPLFFNNEFGLCISFIDQFIQPKTIEQGVFLRDLSQSMEVSKGTKQLPLPIGGIIVLNNHFWLHGRAPFEENIQLHRVLMRQRGAFAPLKYQQLSGGVNVCE